MKKLYPTIKSSDNFQQEVLERKDFQKAIDAIRTKWEIDVAFEIHINEENQGSGSQAKLLKNKKFKEDIKRLQKRFRLDDQYSDFIQDFIFLDFFAGSHPSNFYIEKRTGKNGDSITGEPAYFIRVYPSTTQEDMMKSWGAINAFIHGDKAKASRQKPSKKFIRDKKIFELAQIGYCLEDIQNHFKERDGKEIQFSAIINAESRYRKKIGIKTPSKLGYRKNGKTLTTEQRLVADYTYG